MGGWVGGWTYLFLGAVLFLPFHLGEVEGKLEGGTEGDGVVG